MPTTMQNSIHNVSASEKCYEDRQEEEEEKKTPLGIPSRFFPTARPGRCKVTASLCDLLRRKNIQAVKMFLFSILFFICNL